MFDPDAMPDPIDKAYVEAEAVLSDEAARAARRARVLAAVARQGAPDAAAPAARPRPWRRGGWLVAACVSGLAVIIVSQLYQRPPPTMPSKPTAAAPAPVAAPSRIAAAPASPAPARGLAPPTKIAARTARSEAPPPPAPPPAAPAETAPTPRPPPGAEPTPPPPPPQDIAASERAAPVKPANQSQSANGDADNAGGVTELVVTGAKRESRQQSVPVAVSAFTSRGRDDVVDPGARLRAAAAAGRATEMEALLEHGARVDSADAVGDTALMKSIQADRPAIAALLRRHGASLDQKNNAGESARDMAQAKGDADLNQAIGLGP